MPLLSAEIALQYVKLYRIVYFGGRMGSGKTALAHMVAYQLKRSGFCRYILSNCRSVWNDEPERVVLREGRFVDAVFILDEAGLFMKASREADEFLAYLRKLNIVLLLPSVERPANKLQGVTVQRSYNFQVFGLPLWMYRLDLSSGRQAESCRFFWWQPSEIYGIYDTEGFPSDDAGLSKWQQKWTAAAAQAVGYKAPKSRVSGITWEEPQEAGGLEEAQSGQAVNDASRLVDELRGVAQAIEESSADTSAAVSVLAQAAGRRKRRF